MPWKVIIFRGAKQCLGFGTVCALVMWTVPKGHFTADTDLQHFCYGITLDSVFTFFCF